MQRLKYYYRLLTVPLRRKPDFLVIGAQKSGTSSLYALLEDHPALASSRRKEVHFYDTFYPEKSFSFYRTWFPVNLTKQVFEATPIYLFHPLVPKRVFDDLPHIKFIVSLRNPIDRAYSHYQMVKYKGFEDLPFTEAIAAEPERLEDGLRELDETGFSIKLQRYSYLSRGCYAEQLERWFEYFPRTSFHIILYEDLISSTQNTYDGICDFLGIPRTEASLPHYNAHQYDPLPMAAREELAEYFRIPNTKLSALLNRPLPW